MKKVMKIGGIIFWLTIIVLTVVCNFYAFDFASDDERALWCTCLLNNVASTIVITTLASLCVKSAIDEIKKEKQ